MSGKKDSTNAEIRIYPNPDCRFAYTLNNTQPVRCTYITDQPIFYTDFEGATDDTLLFEDDPVFQALERDISVMKTKTETYDKVAEGFTQSVDATLLLILEDMEEMTRPRTQKLQYRDDAMAPLMDAIGKSRHAAEYIEFARKNGVSIRLSDEVADAHYDRDNAVVLVRESLDHPLQILLLARALRAVWQHKNGAGLHPLSFHPDQAVLINRAQIADQMIAMVRIAWELQLAGEKSAWQRIENSGLADLGRAFAREACIDFRSLNNGHAAVATFESWFLSERCRKADRILIQQMLADYKGYMFSDNADTSRMIALDLITALGKMPFGRNYLQSNAQQIAADPIFTDVRDRSNANFLWFIKFERSFRDAEDQVAAETAPAQAPLPMGQIIDLPAPRRQKRRRNSSQRQNLSDDNADGNVIYLTAKRDAS